MANIPPGKLSESVLWRLPPSKSHMIRWLILAYQSERDVTIKFNSAPGEDILSTKKCLEILGLDIEESDFSWKILGGKKEISSSKITLNCGNSGTATNFLTALAATMDKEVTIYGDESLKRRDFSELNNSLREMGCEISGNVVPFTVKGPITKNTINISTEKSSQPLSAMILSSPNHDQDIVIELQGEGVSRAYADLTINIAKKCGIEMFRDENLITVTSNNIEIPEIIEIPGENSLIPIALLLSELHGVDFIIQNREQSEFLSQGIKMLDEAKFKIIDLRDYSDLITPAAALLAIKNGGKITGVGHTRGKESDRIENTMLLLKDFGIECTIKENDIEIRGAQIPIKPIKVVDTYNDHRIAMTAIALSTFTGGEILNPQISSVTDPEFIEKINNILI
ncbi:MAG: 3-phosphoshikimate 1-carboxyvinyltransferase [Candidatus Poseidoniales archaeon]|jgi:3-phosphoshikimate 1-carboxyvinyltransferase